MAWKAVFGVLLAAWGTLTLAADALPSGGMTVLTTAFGTVLEAYVTGPEDAKRGLVLVHDRYGLNNRLRHQADQFASLGYRVIVPDLYDGRRAPNADIARRVMKQIDPEWVKADLQTAVAALKSPGRKIGVIGWDFGGAGALLGTLQDPTAVQATVVYYSALSADVKALRTLTGPVLGIYGARDTSISEAQITAFSEAMRKAGSAAFIVAKYDAGHGFTNPLSPRYDAKLTAQAEEKTQQFLAEYLGAP